jgi:hypothetical protein
MYHHDGTDKRLFAGRPSCPLLAELAVCEACLFNFATLDKRLSSPPDKCGPQWISTHRNHLVVFEIIIN